MIYVINLQGYTYRNSVSKARVIRKRSLFSRHLVTFNYYNKHIAQLLKSPVILIWTSSVTSNYTLFQSIQQIGRTKTSVVPNEVKKQQGEYYMSIYIFMIHCAKMSLRYLFTNDRIATSRLLLTADLKKTKGFA